MAQVNSVETPQVGEYWLVKFDTQIYKKPIIALVGNGVNLKKEAESVLYFPGIERSYVFEAVEFIRKIELPELAKEKQNNGF